MKLVLWSSSLLLLALTIPVSSAASVEDDPGYCNEPADVLCSFHYCWRHPYTGETLCAYYECDVYWKGQCIQAEPPLPTTQAEGELVIGDTASCMGAIDFDCSYIVCNGPGPGSCRTYWCALWLKGRCVD